MMAVKHDSATVLLAMEQPRPERTKAHFAERIRNAISQNEYPEALAAVSQALVLFPDDPYFLSFCGAIMAFSDRRRAAGGSTFCEEAIRILRTMTSSDKEFFYPVLHLNLGRTYLIRGKRREALEAFRKGLKYDATHEELLEEIRKMGTRRRRVISFLKRSHPVNRALGRLRHKLRAR